MPAPVEEGPAVRQDNLYSLDGEQLGETPIKAKSSVEELISGSCFWLLLQTLLRQAEFFPKSKITEDVLKNHAIYCKYNYIKDDKRGEW